MITYGLDFLPLLNSHSPLCPRAMPKLSLQLVNQTRFLNFSFQFYQSLLYAVWSFTIGCIHIQDFYVRVVYIFLENWTLYQSPNVSFNILTFLLTFFALNIPLYIFYINIAIPTLLFWLCISLFSALYFQSIFSLYFNWVSCRQHNFESV